MIDLVGRDPERDRIERLVSSAARGQSGTLLLVGEAGIGKTALMAHAAERAEALGMRVVRACGMETESDIPFAGLSELLAPLLADPGLDAIAPVQAAALAGALSLATPSRSDRYTVPAAVLGLLAAAAERRPLLVLADDTQWLDSSTLAALMFAGRRLGREGIAMLGAQRAGTETRMAAPAWLDRLRLEPLAPDAARALLARTEPPRIASGVADRLLATAAGNPLALLELPSLLTPGQLAGRQALDDPLPAGTTIVAAFRRRLDGLPADTRRALVVVAAAGTRRVDAVLRGLAPIALGIDALEPAEAAGVLAIGGGEVTFSHPLMRSTVYHAASPGERRGAHRCLAEAFPRGGAERAWHLAACSIAPDEDVAAALEAAARGARERGAHAAAAREFARAAQLTPGDEPRARRLAAAACDASLVGDLEHAAAMLHDALGRTADAELRAELRRLEGHVEMRRGNPFAAHDLLVAEAERAVGRFPQRAASMFLEASVCHMLTGDMHTLIATADRALALARGKDPAVELLATALIGEAYLVLGEVAAGNELVGRVEEPLLAGDPLAAVEIVGLAGHSALWVERYDRAERILGTLVTRARDRGALGALIFPLAAHAQLDLRLGRWSAAYADAAESVDLAEQTANHSLLTFSLASLAQVETALGHEAAAREHAAAALERLGDSQGDSTRVYALAALGQLELSLGRIPEAICHLEQCRRIDVALGVHHPGIVPFRSDLIEAYARAGRDQDALRELKDHEALAASTGQKLAHATALRGRALLAGELEFRGAFERALAAHDDVPQPFERARTLLAYGERLRRAKQRAASRTPLREALAGFERLGARLWAERARAELRATGQTSSRRPASASEQLTPHELQVAVLVAQGMTNREAAAALFLSPKTIEYHLGQIYRKLGVRSRTQLARLIAMEGPEGAPDEAAAAALAA